MRPLAKIGRSMCAFCVACGLYTTCAIAQAPLPAHPPVPQSKQPVTISFVSQITYDSVSRLIRMVSEQVQKGNTDITILIGSTGGDLDPAFTAFNILRSIPAQITTVNVGDVDSAAVILFCAGSKRYSMPGAGMRFLIHGAARSINGTLTSELFQQQLDQVNSGNQMVIQAISMATKDHLADIIKAVKSQTILTPDQAKEWGLVQDTKTVLFQPNSLMLTVSAADTPSVPPNSGAIESGGFR